MCLATRAAKIFPKFPEGTIKLIISYIASSISNLSNIDKTETEIEVNESSIPETTATQEESLKK